MLTTTEEAGIRDILKLMDVQDVISLATTMTNHFVKLETLKDAVNAICLYATSASSVLSRKKVKKEALFRYLYQKNIVSDPHGEKLTVVNIILARWQSPLCQDLVEVTTSPKHEVKHQTVADAPSSAVASTSPMQLMGETFVTWFYHLLNSVHPKFANPNLGDKFGSHHFWSDCRLQLELQCSQQVVQHSCDTSEEVASNLRNVVLQVGLFFNPNVTKEGVETACDAHGLVKVRVSGVVYNTDTCIGMFKQIFGLVRDMSKPDNWKIKFTELAVICNSNIRRLPTSQDTCLPSQEVKLWS